MEQVIVEWTAAEPYTRERLKASSDSALWCHRLYGIKHLRSYAGEGRQMVCVFAAPDAEAVRIAGRKSGAPTDIVWTASLHASAQRPLDDGRPVVVVGRRFAEPADLGALQALEAKGRGCLQRHEVRRLRSYVAAGGRRMLCIYEAPDATTVQQVQREVGLPFEEAWPAAVWLWEKEELTH